MNEPEFHDDGSFASGGTLKGRHLLVIAAVAVLAGAAIYFLFFSGRKGPSQPVGTGVVTEVPEGSRTVTLYFADVDDTELTVETRQVAIGRGFVEQAEQVIRALLAGPELDGVNTIPEGTELLGVYYDPDTAILFVDFSGEFVAGHPGGASAEYHTVSALVKTVSENFPEIAAVQVLVEGSQVGTIAGHINAYQPFLVRDWR
ncbi:MAG: GerMN domain-containing protein [Candidatus Latescibacterota bacterium]|jgi:spore germination protein GerM